MGGANIWLAERILVVGNQIENRSDSVTLTDISALKKNNMSLLVC